MITVLAADLQQSPPGVATRDPRLFYISSSTTTTTLKTSSLCFKSSGTALATTSKRKRRELMQDVPEALDINPSKNVLEEVEFGDLEELHDTTNREPKFLQYWATLTSTTTTTSYTATQTIYSLECTPANFGVSEC